MKRDDDRYTANVGNGIKTNYQFYGSWSYNYKFMKINGCMLQKLVYLQENFK